MPTWRKDRPLKLPRAEHYFLFDRIAAGGMAAVHLGLLRGALGFSRVVAIKRLHATLAQDARRVAMMVDEARVAALVRHVNVVPTLDVIASGGEVFVVMEYVRGAALSSLATHEKEQGRLLPADILVAVLRGALRGLHAAHEATTFEGEPLGIVHRDVSPQNILVGVAGIPRIIDFGVARAAGSLDNTRDGEFKGKLAYASPEQLSGEPVTRRSDVFAMGVILWELLTGQRLFAGETDLDTYRNVLMAHIRHPLEVFDQGDEAGERMRLHRSRAEVERLGGVAMRALAREPDARFPTAEAMEDALGKEAASPAQVGARVRECAADRLAFEHSVVSSVLDRAAELEASDATSAAFASGEVEEEHSPTRLLSPNAPPRDEHAPVGSPLRPMIFLVPAVLAAAFAGSLLGRSFQR